MAVVDPQLQRSGSEEEDAGVEFVAGEMAPTFPFERRDGALIIRLYDQEGVLVDLPVQDTRANEMFGVWLRRFDRY
jgi:hypothetical protein